MANAGTIAVTLTADPKPFTRGLDAARGSTEQFGKAFARLDAQAKRLGSNGGGLSPAIREVGGASSNAARGVQELARGFEDFAVSFGTGGVAGGIRGASNNLSQMASILGGPVAGAIAGFTAAGLSIATPWIASLFEVKSIADDIAKGLEEISNRLVTISDRNRKEIAGIIGFRQEMQGLDSVEGVNAAGKQRQNRLEVIDAEREQIQGQQAQLRMGLGPEVLAEVERLKLKWDDLTEGQKQWVREREAAQQALHNLEVQDLELQRERLRVERERDSLLVKRKELREKEFNADYEQRGGFAAEMIRKNQEQDQQDADKEREKAEQDQKNKEERDRKKGLSDNDRIQGLLKSRIQGLGGNVDPLEGMDISPGLKGRIGGLFDELDALNEKKGGLAGVATAGSQSVARAQYQAKEAAEAKKQRDALIKRLEDLLKEVKSQRRDDDNKDDVNLV